MSLCQNPECGAFIDLPQQGVPFLDRATKLRVLLCQSCARCFDDISNSRYQRVEIQEGASE